MFANVSCYSYLLCIVETVFLRVYRNNRNCNLMYYYFSMLFSLLLAQDTRHQVVYKEEVLQLFILLVLLLSLADEPGVQIVLSYYTYKLL